MLTCLIPIIHPEHASLRDDIGVDRCLFWTLYNLLQHHTPIRVVVLGHRPPSWIGRMQKWVDFVQLDARIFRVLCQLDDGSLELEQAPEEFRPYLELGGFYHNKDKGLKYFLGLLYLSRLPQRRQPEWVALIDGDDYIHRGVGRQLRRVPQEVDLVTVERGYLLFGEVPPPVIQEGVGLCIDGIYPLCDFSHVCGSNRFFRFRPLCERLWRRLNPVIPEALSEKLTKKHMVGDRLVRCIVEGAMWNPDAWGVLPKFLGVHRIVATDECGEGTTVDNAPPHQFSTRFTRLVFPGRMAVKFVHSNNHSCEATSGAIQEGLVKRYREQGRVPSEGNCPDRELLLDRLFRDFGLKTF